MNTIDTTRLLTLIERCYNYGYKENGFAIRAESPCDLFCICAGINRRTLRNVLKRGTCTHATLHKLETELMLPYGDLVVG